MQFCRSNLLKGHIIEDHIYASPLILIIICKYQIHADDHSQFPLLDFLVLNRLLLVELTTHQPLLRHVRLHLSFTQRLNMRLYVILQLNRTFEINSLRLIVKLAIPKNFKDVIAIMLQISVLIII